MAKAVSVSWRKASSGWLAKIAASVVILVALLATAQASPPPAGPALAIMETPNHTPLADILSGRARPGFTPILENAIVFRAEPGTSVWLRLRLDIPTDGKRYWLRVDRQAIDRLRLHVPGPPPAQVAETGLGKRAGPDPEWPDAFLMPLPEDSQGLITVYLEVDGQGLLYMRPEILSADALEARDRSSQLLYGALYGLLMLLALAAIFRQFTRPTAGAWQVLLAVAALGVACAATNDHLDMLPLGNWIASLGPKVVPAGWLVACAPLLWSSAHYAGLDKTREDIDRWFGLAGGAFLVLGVAAIFVPLYFLPELQLAAIFLLAAVMLACISVHAMDKRQSRWGPILVCLAVIAALAARVLVIERGLPASLLTRRGFEVMLAMLLAMYLVLPWLRQKLETRAKTRRVVVQPLSTEEKIAQAREQLMAGLNAALMNAAEGDLEWIAYRRLLEGLKPVLPQMASAVVAMNYHHEDLMLVEPRSAEARYRMLLSQRGRLMKHLSRSRAPQQIGMDFDGPEGPLETVQLAVIPLPIAKPGWGALLIERIADIRYSEDELDLCAEFAALATTAGDEAAEAMMKRQAAEIDAESGVYKRDIIEQARVRLQDQAHAQHASLAIMRIGIDKFEAIPPAAIAACVQAVVDLIREEVDYGDVIGRVSRDEFLVLMPGRKLGVARELADRLCALAATLASPVGRLTLSIGVTASQPGERGGNPLMSERGALALSKARQYGGNQVQVVGSTTV